MKNKGIAAGLSSAVFLGAVPIFGKIAMLSGLSPFALIAIRSSFAALLMLLVMAIGMRKYFYIYPVGLAGCLLAGLINGLGSILYYMGLNRLDASLGHMLYSFYPLFVALWLLIDRQQISWMSVIRLVVSVPAVILLLQTKGSAIDITGAVMMLGSAALYALHLLINQRVLYEAPAQTVTLYTLISMALTVLIAYILLDFRIPPVNTAWWAVLAMGLITFISRFALFMGIKHLGGMQTALLGLSEIIITVILSAVWLNEQLSPMQWIGAVLLAINILLIGLDHVPQQRRKTTGWLSWLNLPAPDLRWPGQP